MIALNLEAKTDCERIVKQHLEQMVSETLAEKINKGITIEKDGQRVVNRKTLATFMAYATEQAKALIPKEKQHGAQQCPIDGEQIMAWAIHYFEEESIEGTLYTLDGKELSPAPKKTPQTAAPVKPAKKQDAQMSFFGMMAENEHTMSETDDEEIDEDEETDAGDGPDEDIEDGPETEDAEDEAEEADEEGPAEDEPEGQGLPFYQCYKKFAAKYPDAVLFLRLGDFYEALGDHAIKISDALGLTLTGRDCGLKNRVPMCGVPYHAFEVYLSKLLERGYRVAVAEELTGFHFMNTPTQRIDEETGEVLPDTKEQAEDAMDEFDTSAIDKEVLCVLLDLFGDDIDVR